MRRSNSSQKDKSPARFTETMWQVALVGEILLAIFIVPYAMAFDAMFSISTVPVPSCLAECLKK
jgi:hypothetical protein